MTLNNTRLGKIIGWSAIALFVIVAISSGNNNTGSNSDKPPAAVGAATVSPCKTDWTKCADNSDMVNNFKGWVDVQRGCKRQATDMAKYGTPELAWFPFSSFYPGTDFSTGIVTAIEPDARFSNGFGAMVRSRVVCKYDLRTNKVIDVSIGER